MPLFVAAEALAIDALIAALPDDMRARVSPPARVERRLLDTFDWRLERRGLLLEYQTGRPGRLLLHLPGRDEPLALEVGAAPAGPGDLPASALREHLAVATAGRALIEVGRSRAEVVGIEATDRRGRPVARLSLESDRVRPRSRALVRLRLAPVAGQGPSAARITEALSAVAGAPAPSDPLGPALMAAAGRIPSRDAARPAIAPRPDDPLGVVLSELLRGFGGVLEATRPGTLARTDTEYLHDFRVAVRRLRVVVAHARHVLAEPRRQSLAGGLRWLGGLTGPARDSDVAIEWASGLGGLLAPSQVAALEPLSEHLVAWNQRAYADLTAALASPRYRRVLDQIERAADAVARARRPGARVATGEWAGARVGRLYRRALRQGRAIDAGSPAEALHDLRKTAKRLRYTLEFYRPALDESAVGPAVAALRELQDTLGDYQDAEVQAALLVDAAHRLAAEGAAPATMLALGVLAERLGARQAAARAEFADRFTAFSSAKVRRRYAAIQEVDS